MKKTLITLGACAMLSAAPLHAFAHGNQDTGAALLGGVLGGLIGGAIVAPPAYRVYGTVPVVVEGYAPPPVVVVRRHYVAPPPAVVYYRDGRRGWHDRGWHDGGWRGHRWHGHDGD